jgi:integrase
MLVVMLATGMRIGETLGLRWQDVDLVRARLRVVQQQTVLPGQPVQFTAPKSKSGRRTIPLIPAAIDALHAQRARVLAYQLRIQRDREWPAYDLVFPDYLGEPLVGQRVGRRFKELLEDAELPATFTPHSLRHSTATYLMAVGMRRRSSWRSWATRRWP